MRSSTSPRIFTLTVLVACVPLPVVPAASSARPAHYQLHRDDRVRLAEADRLRHAIENRVWPSWAAAPFAVLLVTDSVEFLFWHTQPSDEFVPQGYDSVLHTEVFARPRHFAANLLATFPAVSSTPTIVIGQPVHTGKNSSLWVLTVLHEHFHQLQFSRPGYYRALDTLGLARGDQSGMWMLNYPFPYDSVPIQRLTNAAATALAEGLDASTPPTRDVLSRSSATYEALRAALSLDDRRYLEFQLWQEGVARYTEYTCALQAAQADPPSAAFAALPDYVPYAAVAPQLFAEIVHGLRRPDLGVSRRTSFYALGAAFALLLDRVTPAWKERYFSPMFTLALHFQALPPPTR